MGKFQLMQILKAAKLPVIIGCILSVPGLVLAIIGGVVPISALLWIGIVILGGGILSIAVGISNAKDVVHAICPSCQKFMGETDQTVEYSISLAQTEKVFDSMGKDTGRVKFSYDYTITCPHCGNTAMQVFTVTERNAANAHTVADKYVKRILKVKTKE